jgi:hypothetical protein
MKELSIMTTCEFKDLIDLPVVSKLGSTRDWPRAGSALHPSANALFGLVVAPVEKNAPLQLIQVGGPRAIGRDAITVESQDVAEPFADNAREGAVKSVTS